MIQPSGILQTRESSGGAVYPVDIGYSALLDGVSDYLSRTPTVTGDQRRFTIHCSFKRWSFGTPDTLFACGSSASNYLNLFLTDTGALTFRAASPAFNLISESIFEDPTHHYHLTIAVDTTAGVASDRIKIWVNGQKLTDFTTETYPAQNALLSIGQASIPMALGRWAHETTYPGALYLSNCHYINDQALDYSSFGGFSELAPNVFVAGNFDLAAEAYDQRQGFTGGTAYSDHAALTDNMFSEAFAGATDAWRTSGYNIGWGAYIHGTAKTYAAFSVQLTNGASSYYSAHAPKDFTIQGSNDTTDGTDGTWDTIITVTSETWTYEGERKVYAPADPVTYKAIKLDVTAAVSNNYCYVGCFRGLEAAGATMAGSNSFHLDFADGVELGKDVSGNGSHFTVNGSPVQSIDTPTSNYATMTELMPPTPAAWGTLSNGGLTLASVADRANPATFKMAEGKWYWEVVWDSGTYSPYLGITEELDTYFPGRQAYSYGYHRLGRLYYNNTYTTPGTGYVVGDVVMFALDMDLGALWIGVNGTWHNSATLSEIESGDTTNAMVTGLTAPQYAAGSTGATADTLTFDFGQNGYVQTPPSGFVALADTNRPEPTLLDPSLYFHNSTFVAPTVADQQITVGWDAETSDWLLILRNISGGAASQWFDTVRGLDKQLLSPGTTTETTVTALSASGNTITIPDSVMTDGATYEVMVFKSDPAAGFEIVGYTGDGANRLLPHNLGSTPKWFVARKRDGGASWIAYTEATGNTKYMIIDGSAEARTSFNFWNTISPTSTTISLSSLLQVNGASSPFILYAFADSELYKFIEYTGNGAVDGPYVDTDGTLLGMLFLRNTAIASFWHMLTQAKTPQNPIDRWWSTHDAVADGATHAINATGTGMKVPVSTSYLNGNSQLHCGLAVKTQNKYRNAY